MDFPPRRLSLVDWRLSPRRTDGLSFWKSNIIFLGMVFLRRNEALPLGGTKSFTLEETEFFPSKDRWFSFWESNIIFLGTVFPRRTEVLSSKERWPSPTKNRSSSSEELKFFPRRDDGLHPRRNEVLPLEGPKSFTPEETKSFPSKDRSPSPPKKRSPSARRDDGLPFGNRILYSLERSSPEELKFFLRRNDVLHPRRNGVLPLGGTMVFLLGIEYFIPRNGLPPRRTEVFSSKGRWPSFWESSILFPEGWSLPGGNEVLL